MASIQRIVSPLTGLTAYRVQVRKKGHPPASATFPNRKEAKDWAGSTEAAIREGRHYPRAATGATHTVGEAAIRYAREVLHVDLPPYEDSAAYESNLVTTLERPWVQPAHPDTPADARNTLARLMWWRAELRQYALAAVTDTVLAGLLTKLRTEPYTRSTQKGARQFHRTEKTVNRYIAAGSRLFRVALKRWHWVPHNPFEEVERTSEAGGRTRTLNPGERERLFNELRANCPTLFAFSMTARATIVRAGMLQRLLKTDVEFATLERTDTGDTQLVGRLTFPTSKNGEPHVAWIFGAAAETLRAHIDAGDPAEPRAFVSPGRVYPRAGRRRAGKLYRYHTPFVAACARADVKDFTFHGWRHDGATHLARLGATAQQLRRAGPWKSNVVNKYIHLAAEDVRGVMQQMNRAIEHKTGT